MKKMLSKGSNYFYVASQHIQYMRKTLDSFKVVNWFYPLKGVLYTHEHTHKHIYFINHFNNVEQQQTIHERTKKKGINMSQKMLADGKSNCIGDDNLQSCCDFTTTQYWRGKREDWTQNKTKQNQNKNINYVNFPSKILLPH